MLTFDEFNVPFHWAGLIDFSDYIILESILVIGRKNAYDIIAQ